MYRVIADVYEQDIEYYISGNIRERKYCYFEIENQIEIAFDNKEWNVKITLIDNNNSEQRDADLYVRYDRYECIRILLVVMMIVFIML